MPTVNTTIAPANASPPITRITATAMPSADQAAPLGRLGRRAGRFSGSNSMRFSLVAATSVHLSTPTHPRPAGLLRSAGRWPASSPAKRRVPPWPALTQKRTVCALHAEHPNHGEPLRFAARECFRARVVALKLPGSAVTWPFLRWRWSSTAEARRLGIGPHPREVSHDHLNQLICHRGRDRACVLRAGEAGVSRVPGRLLRHDPRRLRPGPAPVHHLVPAAAAAPVRRP